MSGRQLKHKFYSQRLSVCAWIVASLTNWSKHVLWSRCPQSGMWQGYLDVWMSPKHTGQFDREIFSTHRCPLIFKCSGKHMLQTSQWKKLFRPPMRHMPQPSQWYWSLSSSSNRLHIKQVYWNGKWELSNRLAGTWSRIELTFPNRTPQFSHSACTFCRLSHFVHISSVSVFLSKWWSSFSSWQNRHL